jgi:isoleucyl-tRNA synthetase
VELEVERELGLSTKREIEAYGVAAFNQKCRESVFRYVNEWERMTERVGFWVDMEDAYVTYSNEYIETGWWIFKRFWDNDLVFQDFRVTPHCPRCQTSLSSHEIAQGYEDDTPDPGVTLRFRLPADAPAPDSLRLADGVPTSLLAWTTTPWTLSGNTALAILSEAEYALVEVAREDQPVERVVLSSSLVGSVVGEDGSVIGTLSGTDLLRLEYEPLYPESVEWVEPLVFVEGRTQRLKGSDPLPARRVIASDEVTTEEGTGILHVAPAFGEADYAMGRAEGLMFLQPVRPDGTMIGGPADGAFVKTGDSAISDDLRERRLLFKAETIRHTYPFCWRCGTSVLYYAKPSWYIRTTAVADLLVEHNQQIHWVPENIKNGRFGEWLEGNVDWAVSRERYWGTPLPIWVCEICEHIDAIGSFEELRSRARTGTTEALETDHGFDAHRPYVDGVELDCPRCNGTMRRTPEVADGWFDSGAMPYAQWHYPFENQDTFDERFPADFICEAVDQTRGWFYTLHALATLLHRTEDVPEGISYRNVISLGHILDGNGQKMSKSKGNVVDPWTVLDQHGADATRWYMYTASPPGNARRFSEDLVAETTRRFLSTLWNTYSFFVMYANLADFDPVAEPTDDEEPTELDRWARSELHSTVQRVTEALEAYELSDAARPIEQFVEGLSNWYVRRSRRRFWRSGDDADSRVALRTLYESLVTVSKLLAPFTPFVAESLYRNLVGERLEGADDSVHLARWPDADEAAIDETLSAEMEVVQRMVSLGRAARSSAQLRVRQPLGTAALVPRTEAERTALVRLAPLIADELNVKTVDVLKDGGDRVAYKLRPNLPVLGPKFGREVGKIRGALDAADAPPIVRAMRAGEPVQLGEFELGGGDILVGVEAAEGWAAAEDGGYVALLDTTITEELRSEGFARELVRRLQDLRREADLEVSDRIEVRFASDGPAVAQAFAEHGTYIAEETLALEIEAGIKADWASADAKIDGLSVTLALRKASSS